MPLAPGPSVVEMLEFWLAKARAGEIGFAAVAAVQTDNKSGYDYAGPEALETLSQRDIRVLRFELETLVQLAEELEARRKGRTLGPRNYNLDASKHEYHLTGPTPICWDYLIWLVDAEMTRRRLGGPPPLRIAFTGEERLAPIDKVFFDNVFRPLLPLIGAVEDNDAIGGRHKPLYTPIDICMHARDGEEVPRLTAPDTSREQMSLWLHGEKPVTITLREAPNWPHRNSNVEAWCKFARDLEAKGQPVIVLRDTWKAAEPLDGLATLPHASVNIHARMALYEQARANLFVSNGPAGLALFGDRPYLYFLDIHPDKIYAPANPGWWYDSNGVHEGDQWPWALPTQRLVWKPDTYENIHEAWEELCPMLI